MATLTYNPDEQVEGELTEDEQDSLAVGEKLVEQQEEMLAGKFKTAEDLEKGYIELQKKLGEPKEEKAEAEPEEKPEAKEEKEEKPKAIDTEFLDKLWDEAAADKYTDDTLQQLEKMSARDIAQMHLQYRTDNPKQQKGFTEKDIKNIQDGIGGKENYTQMLKWAAANLSENDINMYDKVIDKGDPLAAFFAVQALNYRFQDSVGVDGKMLTGKASKAEGDVFKSQAQVVKAMEDSRYDKDPAYRQEIYEKLERSNINF